MEDTNVVGNTPNIANAGPTITVIFSTFCVLFWAMLCGYVKPEGALLLGIIQLATIPVFLTSAITVLKHGDGLGGNTFMYFCAFFATGGGLINTVTYFASIYHWPLDFAMVGWLWICVAIVLGGTLPGFRKTSWMMQLVMIFVTIALAFMGLAGIGVIAASFNVLAGWLLGATGVLGLYLAIGGIVASVGINLPVGKPLY